MLNFQWSGIEKENYFLRCIFTRRHYYLLTSKQSPNTIFLQIKLHREVFCYYIEVLIPTRVYGHEAYHWKNNIDNWLDAVNEILPGHIT